MLKLLRQGVIVFSIQDKVSHRIAFAWCLSNKNCLFKFVTAVGSYVTLKSQMGFSQSPAQNPWQNMKIS